MSEFRNRIITISGNQSTGKSTVIKKLKEDYENKGYIVHIFSVGHEFRKLAAERSLSIEELNEYMLKRESIDELIDSTVAQRGKEINSKERPNNIYIFDSRWAFHNIPDSFSIRLTADDNVAGKRAFGDETRGYVSLEEAIEKTRERKESEVERYLKRYGINLADPQNYKLVIDTSYSSVEDIASVIEQCVELDLEEKSYGKMWTSPKKLLPLQSEIDTMEAGWDSNLTLEELATKIRKEGYNPASKIEVIEVDGRLYILEGHHRNFAAAKAGNTLIPYSVVAKNDEMTPYGLRARERVNKYSFYIENLQGHERFLDKEEGKITKWFSYNEIYPNIYDELLAREREEEEK